ncbi:signal recognition particle-docking protein FtsY [Legionella geestiana]|nr:signal recognition particle-docking protein FtsY [Legionella geestiana]QBS12573.1 signal recognition particle-docking protein FtsY [Legionella geestiana]QDQ39711.1 signal recognition particle-docking protein FtsY [Legionella geestiana]STX54976.1 cell division membrane protein FtsY [Legionella geestiana]
MMKWFKRNTTPEAPTSHEPGTQVALEAPRGIFERFREGLGKTRHQLGERIGRLFLGRKEISPELLEELETLLISADVGIDTATRLTDALRARLARHQLKDSEALFTTLEEDLRAILAPCAQPLEPMTPDASPFVILMVGINGAGKTTTAGKLARHFREQGKRVMLAAGDTFRAAAVEQLQAWGERNDVAVVAQSTGADSASVVFDAFQSAKARGMDILIADTAGRLHTQGNLMEELRKIRRVLQKIDPAAPHETMLVLDAGIGQNAVNQAREFHEAVAVSGITMTKLDGTARGGILLAIADTLKIPLRFVGMGEGIDDLRPFDANAYVRAILGHDDVPEHGE